MSRFKRKFRPYTFFLFPDSEREEPFLNDMSQIGWHLVETNYFNYIFEKGKPEDYQYRMDFVSKELGRREYIQLLQDAGWEIVDTRRDELGLWAYCRKPRSEEDTLELYTDAESKLEYIGRIRRAYWRMNALAAGVIVLLLAIKLLTGGMPDWGNLIVPLIGGVIGGTISYIPFRRKIRKIKQDTDRL